MIPPPADDRFRLSGPLAGELAAAYGTPLYVVGEAHFRSRVRAYIDGFRAASPNSETTFASKANSTLAVVGIAHAEGCSIDVASEGELRAALAAGVPAADCTFHGNNKTRGELAFALEQGIGKVVADHFGELDLLAELGATCRIVIRLAPGVDPVTHHKISTGQSDTKFGFNIADGSGERALRKALDLGLDVVGFHCHVGSQLLDPEAQQVGGELIASFARDMKERHGFETRYLNVGGGLGVRYTSEDEPMPVAEYCRLVVDSITQALAGSGLDPVLGQEPGRSMIGESGVTLYTVGVVKTVPVPGRGERTYLAVDGGLSDNPRPALYGSRYTVERVASTGGAFTPQDGMKTFTVSGKHCETDRLFEDVVLPADTAPGDLLQVLVTGAYNASMASNYNRYPRPASVLVRADGSHCLIQRREDWDAMLEREILPEGLR